MSNSGGGLDGSVGLESKVSVITDGSHGVGSAVTAVVDIAVALKMAVVLVLLGDAPGPYRWLYSLPPLVWWVRLLL